MNCREKSPGGRAPGAENGTLVLVPQVLAFDFWYE